MAQLQAALPDGAFRKCPANPSDDRLLGGLDLAATLRAGRPIVERGLLADADGRVLVIAMAERLSSHAVGHITAALDQGAVSLERDGIAAVLPARFGVVACDEGEADEALAASLADRLALWVDLHGISYGETLAEPGLDGAEIKAARTYLASVTITDHAIGQLCQIADALGIPSLRAAQKAVAAARASAALSGRDCVAPADCEAAAALVLAPRATRLPTRETDPTQDQPENPPDGSPEPPSEPDSEARQTPQALDDIVLEAALAALPPDLLRALAMGQPPRARRTTGKSGAANKAARGRPLAPRAGKPGAGNRLNLVATLRAAAPWQAIRAAKPGQVPAQMIVRPEDFRISRHKARTSSLTIFVVDASGSAALARLAEAKGAVELLLAESYVRRDEVAVIAFRGAGAQCLLPPTRSLTRAKRALAELPGGGGTPLAIGLETAHRLAAATLARGSQPSLVILTDGRANIDRSGQPGRPQAESDGQAAARAIARARLPALVIDTSQRPSPPAKALATAMAAVYVALPRADARGLRQIVRDHTT